MLDDLLCGIDAAAQDLAEIPFDPRGAHQLIIKSISANQRPAGPRQERFTQLRAPAHKPNPTEVSEYTQVMKQSTIVVLKTLAWIGCSRRSPCCSIAW